MHGNQSYRRPFLLYKLEWIEAREIDIGYCRDADQADSSLKRGKVGKKKLIVMGIATRVGLKPWVSPVIAALRV